MRSPGSRLTVRLSAFVSVVSLCSFYMCCCCSLSLFTPLPSSVIPNFPAPGTHLSRQELEKPLSGARPLPHPPSQDVCPALPSVPPFCTSRWPGSLAGRGAIKAWGRRAGGPRALHPTHSQAYQSSSRAWPFEPPERGLYLSPPPSLQEDYRF